MLRLLPALLVLLAGCSSTQLPDLKNLYGVSQEYAEQPPVVLVHGVLGSRLDDPDTGTEVWPGSVGRPLFHEYTDLAFTIDQALRDRDRTVVYTAPLVVEVPKQD